MSTTKRIRLAAAGLVTAVGSVLAVTASASPAVAFFSPPLFLDVQIESPGTLIARGAAVDVTVEVVCTSPTATVSVTVTQVVGGRQVARGFGLTEVGCTRSGERVPVTVSTITSAFRKGSAFVTADVSACVPEVCGSESDQETIKLR